DTQALLLALARHKRELCDDLDGAVLAFRRAVKLAPGTVRALFGPAATLLARSERVEQLAAAADRLRPAQLCCHLPPRGPAECLPIDEEPLRMPRPSPQPPPELLAPQPRKAKPPAPPAAARPAPPAAALQHPRVVNVLPDDPTRVSLEVNVGSTTDSNFYVD